MDASFIVSDIQIGLIMIGLERPVHVTMSTFDLDLTLFATEYYDPVNTYDLWYWYLEGDYNTSNIPPNVHLHQLEKNHAKFWYIENETHSRLIVTSANMTRYMMHGCLQSYASVTCKKGSIGKTDMLRLSKDYMKVDPFFRIYNVTLSLDLYSLVAEKILYNIPSKINALERWFMLQEHIVVDSNNINVSYLPKVKKDIIIRTSVPTSNKIIAYYNTDKYTDRKTDCVNACTNIVNVPYTKDFHYKLYYTHKCILISSNNFSYNYKNNYELGILVEK